MPYAVWRGGGPSYISVYSGVYPSIRKSYIVTILPPSAAYPDPARSVPVNHFAWSGSANFLVDPNRTYYRGIFEGTPTPIGGHLLRYP
jgi:hypothetical protein